MTDQPITHHVDTMARAAATLGMQFISAPVIIDFCDKRGILGWEENRVAQLRRFIETFLARYPVWVEDTPMARGLLYQPDKASRHARLAWLALCARVLEEEGAP